MREIGPLKKRMDEVESSIAAKEERLKAAHADIAAASMVGDGAAFARLSREAHILQEEIDGLFAELEILIDEYERKLAPSGRMPANEGRKS